MATYRKFDEIPLFRYGLVMADFPWDFEGWSKKKRKAAESRHPAKHYDLMTLRDLYAIPMSQYVGPHSILWFWTTGPFFHEACRMIDHWGFRYVTSGFWGKVQKGDPTKPRMGSGHVLRECGEPFIIAKIGTPAFPANDVPGLILAPRRESGRKPEQCYALAEKLAPKGLPMLDMFSRQRRPGWDQFGNEPDKFEAAPESETPDLI